MPILSFDDILEYFGWNPVRRRQLDGLSEALELLAEAGCRRVWLNGSFGGELFPYWVESGSGLRFAEFFQRDRNGTPKGIIVIHLQGTTQ